MADLAGEADESTLCISLEIADQDVGLRELRVDQPNMHPMPNLICIIINYMPRQLRELRHARSHLCHSQLCSLNISTTYNKCDFVKENGPGIVSH